MCLSCGCGQAYESHGDPSRLLKKWLLEGKNTHFHI
jgi:hypothetical protein